MAMCIHSQEFETCRFGCTLKKKEELRLENDQLQAELEKHKEALVDMCCQFAFWSDCGGYWTGGFSALEDAFGILGWEDPHLCKDACCQIKGCKKQATCGTPTPEGYKRLCSNHYIETKQALKENNGKEDTKQG